MFLLRTPHFGSYCPKAGMNIFNFLIGGMNISRDSGAEHQIRRSVRYSSLKCSLDPNFKDTEHIFWMPVPGLKDNMAHSGPKDMFSACTCACYNFMHVDLKLNMWSNRLFRCGSIFFSISRTDHLSGLYTINSLHEDWKGLIQQVWYWEVWGLWITVQFSPVRETKQDDIMLL